MDINFNGRALSPNDFFYWLTVVQIFFLNFYCFNYFNLSLMLLTMEYGVFVIIKIFRL